MAFVLREITREIATNLVSELKGGKGEDSGAGQAGRGDNLWQVLLNGIAKEVVEQLKDEYSQPAPGRSNTRLFPEKDILKDIRIQVNGKEAEEGLDKAEEKLRKTLNRSKCDEEEDAEADTKTEDRELDDLDDVDLKTIEKLEKKGVRVIYPNLKYRKPKYQNVSEVLKYVESDKEKAEGVKLVIMNFND